MKQAAWLGFSINRNSTTPVFEQICHAIRSRAIAGEIAQGSKLPPTRVFATELGVSRSTIVTAYDQLVAEGYLSSQQGSGYRLCAAGEVELGQGRARGQALPPKGQSFAPEAPRLKSQPAGGQGGTGPVPFRAGTPDMRLFPHRQWAKTVARICRSNPQTMFDGGGGFGALALRQAICDHVSEWRGISAHPDQVIVTAGATDAIEICLHALTQPQDRIVLENPGYSPLKQFVLAQGLRPCFVPVDGSGAMVPEAEDDTRLAILTPSHQFPLGGAMTPARRMEYIQWATDCDAWIIEDDYDSEFRYAGRPIPAMAGFDGLNRTLYVGSFSKIFSNALRMGYLILPEALVERVQQSMRRFGSKASSMPQQPLADFITSGEFYRHLRRVRRLYGERRKFLLDRLARDFADFGHCLDHHAGMQLVFYLRPGLEDRAICVQAKQAGVSVEALSSYVQAEGGDRSICNGLVLGFCGHNIEELEEALDRLGQVCLSLKRASIDAV